MLYRSVKRRTSFELEPLEFCDAEFQDSRSGGLDHNISVYQIDAGRLIACHSEHYAGARLTPPGNPAFDLAGLANELRNEPRDDTWPFVMTRLAHCEAGFDSDEAVRVMADRLFTDLPQRTHPVSSDDMRRYLTAAVAAEDAEWIEFLRGASGEWRRLAGLGRG